jgi:hypothetical protein
LIAGLVALAAGILVLRTYGPRYRVGRLLAATPDVTVAEARALSAGKPHYVRIRGRIDAEDEFEDDAHRPLVFRRTRLQLRQRGRWVTFDGRAEAGPFEIRDGLDSIAIDDARLDARLVVIPRESVGPPPTSRSRARRDGPTTRSRSVSNRSRPSSTRSSTGVPVSTTPACPALGGHGPAARPDHARADEAMRILAEGGRARPLLARHASPAASSSSRRDRLAVRAVA